MVWIIRCCYVDKLIYSVDNFVKVLYLLCFETWITLLCVRVVRTILMICLCVVDSMCLCVTDIFDDGIVFGIWYVVTTLGMFFGVILG